MKNKWIFSFGFWISKGKSRREDSFKIFNNEIVPLSTVEAPATIGKEKGLAMFINDKNAGLFTYQSIIDQENLVPLWND